MEGNIIPYIGGEEEKSEQEPLRLWGEIKDGEIVKASEPVITCQCIRVPAVSYTHLNLTLKHRAKLASHRLFSLYLISAQIKYKCRLCLAVCHPHAAAESHRSGLVGTAGRRLSLIHIYFFKISARVALVPMPLPLIWARSSSSSIS